MKHVGWLLEEACESFSQRRRAPGRGSGALWDMLFCRNQGLRFGGSMIWIRERQVW